MFHSNHSEHDQSDDHHLREKTCGLARVGHLGMGSGDLTTMNKKLTKKCIENVLSGRWSAETPAELEALRAHKERKKSNA